MNKEKQIQEYKDRMKNITTVASRRTGLILGYRVRMSVNGKEHRKSFNISEYNSVSLALDEAKKYRDNLLSKRKTREAQISSRTGYPNMTIKIDKDNYSLLVVYGRGREKAFSIDQYGYKVAMIQGAIWLKNTFKNVKYTEGLWDNLSTRVGMLYLKDRLPKEKYDNILEKTQFSNSVM